MNTCPVCSKTFEQSTTGRRRVYCSGACRTTAHRRRAETLVGLEYDERAVLGPDDVERLVADLIGNGARDPVDELGDLLVVSRCLSVRLQTMTLPPALAWRARTLGQGLTDGLREHFGGLA